MDIYERLPSNKVLVRRGKRVAQAKPWPRLNSQMRMESEMRRFCFLEPLVEEEVLTDYEPFTEFHFKTTEVAVDGEADREPEVAVIFPLDTGAQGDHPQTNAQDQHKTSEVPGAVSSEEPQEQKQEEEEIVGSVRQDLES